MSLISTTQQGQQSWENQQTDRNAPYVLPNPDDGQELDRLDLQHYMLRYLLQGNYLAPIAQPERILDVGSGTGRWLREMAQEFPQAELTGFDLTLPESGANALPPNCRFRTGNALNGLPFEDASFDFVHQRLLMFAVPLPSWQPLVNELARVTRRNGWVEIVEVNPFLQQTGPTTGRIVDLIVQFSRQRGLDPDIWQHLEPLLHTAGLQHVEMNTRMIPVGKWGGEPGTMALSDIVAIVLSMKPLVTAQMQMTPEAFDALVKEMEQEVEQYHTTLTFHIAYGQQK